MKISQLSNTKVLISLCEDDMKSFDLSFEKIGLSDPHSKKILTRLLNLACQSNFISTDGKAVVLEALPSMDGMMILISIKEKKYARKKYRIKRIKEYPCYRFENAEMLLTAIEKLCDTDIFFYNNSAYFYKDSYYLVFDYPVLAQKAKNILSEFASKINASKTFVARLHESAKMLSSGNAIVSIGLSL
ncbi:MAG: adaptor protein MecA [Ruminococcus sp.]|nr:adaptor protein MecA [Ruminococcus sp.]